MHLWNLWGSVPPTRLRTTILESSKTYAKKSVHTKQQFRSSAATLFRLVARFTRDGNLKSRPTGSLEVLAGVSESSFHFDP